MIHHLSIAARDPKHSAEVLAEIMGGKSVPFPPNPGSFFALQLDDHGSGVEVLPPDFAAEYPAWTRPDTVATRMGSAPTSGSRPTRVRSA